jgi:hypothetical protein
MGSIRSISFIDLMVNILSLNVIMFLVSPILKVIAGITDDELKKIIKNRKKENVTIILKGLRP